MMAMMSGLRKAAQSAAAMAVPRAVQRVPRRADHSDEK
jgi:hypothetical protein